MPEVELERSEPQRVEDWRRQRLVWAGYPPELAAEVASSDADLHEAIELVRRGCPPDVAAAILI
jgi:hypothetical protein